MVLTTGLAGETDLERIQADIVSDCVEDVLNCFLKYHQQMDEIQKVTYFNM